MTLVSFVVTAGKRPETSSLHSPLSVSEVAFIPYASSPLSTLSMFETSRFVALEYFEDSKRARESQRKGKTSLDDIGVVDIQVKICILQPFATRSHHALSQKVIVSMYCNRERTSPSVRMREREKGSQKRVLF